MKPTLVVLAAGMGSRYGGLKQIDPVGPSGEAIRDYSVFYAHRAGFGRVVVIILRDIEQVFREKVGSKYEGLLPVDYAFQDIADLPPPYAVPPGRAKPWGTAPAIRAARGIVGEPFAAINADDFYGRDAFAKLASFLASVGETEPPSVPHPFAMAGYRLDQTLSDFGSVARGICRVSAEGKLEKVTEMTKIVRVASGAENREDPSAPVPLTGRERVSMNLWGFTPALFEELEARFPAWLEANAAREKAEWYIPFVVDELIHEGRATVDVLPTESAWFGATYREDKPLVAAAIRRLVESGEYPSNLFVAG